MTGSSGESWRVCVRSGAPSFFGHNDQSDAVFVIRNGQVVDVYESAVQSPTCKTRNLSRSLSLRNRLERHHPLEAYCADHALWMGSAPFWANNGGCAELCAALFAEVVVPENPPRRRPEPTPYPSPNSTAPKESYQLPWMLFSRDHGAHDLGGTDGHRI